ncbi:sensor domain-containing diguanylate cyclase [bacterium]|nr:sensor domain-containing diguanylate cyclase [bacterium]
MDTTSVEEHKKLINRTFYNNYYVRYFVNPIIFFMYLLYYNYNRDAGYLHPIWLGIPLSLSFIFNTISNVYARGMLKKNSLPEKINKMLYRTHLLNNTMDILFLSFFTPFIGGITSPFTLILIMEIIAVTFLFPNKVVLLEITMFFMIQLIFIIFGNSFSFEYIFELLLYGLVLTMIPFMTKTLLTPLYVTNREIIELDKAKKGINRLKRKKQQLEQLHEITSEIVYSKDVGNILTFIVEGVKNVLNCDVVLLSTFDKGENVFKRAAYAGLTTSEWDVVRPQKVPMGDVDKLLREEFKITGGYYIPGAYIERVSTSSYTLTLEDKEELQTLRDGNWSPSDIILFPIHGREGDILGYFTVDRPENRRIPVEDVLNELLVFINTAGFAIQNITNYQELNNLYKRIRMVYAVNEVITKLSGEEGYLNTVANIIKNSLGYLNVAILLREEDHLKISASIGYDVNISSDVKLKIGRDGITGWVAKTGISQIVNDVAQDPRYVKGVSSAMSELAVAIRFGKDNILGVLDVESGRKNAFTSHDIELLSLVANQLGIAIKNNQLFQQTAKLAKTDEMTKLYNYRIFRESLQRELSRARRYNHPFSVIMIDIDNFKSVNDTYGHPQGDEVLKELARIMRKEMRDTDILARYGGEEFIIILPETKKKQTIESAERLLKAVEANQVPMLNSPGKFISITISSGVATFPEDATEDEELIQAVDNALYRAKKNGKNRVELA